MLSLVELKASVAPAKLKPLLEAVPVWNGAVPVQVGVKPFQSMQPAVLIARLPSASSKPEASAIVLSAPPGQMVAAGAASRFVIGRNAEKNEAPELESECWARNDRDTREACPCVRASPGRWYAPVRPEAAPTVSNETTS